MSEEEYQILYNCITRLFINELITEKEKNNARKRLANQWKRANPAPEE